MALYIGNKQEHGKGWFSFWIWEISPVELVFGLVIFLSLLWVLALIHPLFGILIDAGIIGIVYLLIKKRRKKNV